MLFNILRSDVNKSLLFANLNYPIFFHQQYEHTEIMTQFIGMDEQEYTILC